MPDNNDFFNKDMNPQDNPQDPQVFTVGEKQYTQEELQAIVPLGEVASEFQNKWNRDINDLYPEFTRRSQRLGELESEVQTLKSREEEAARARIATGQVTPEDEARVIKEQARKYGLTDEDRAREIMREELDADRNKQLAQQLIHETESFLENQAKSGMPKADPRELLTFMDERGITSYQDAYEIRYKNELAQLKVDELMRSKPTGMYTQSQSTAGAKEPVERRVTHENLTSAIDETLNRFR